jgi:hypothetical protein
MARPYVGESTTSRRDTLRPMPMRVLLASLICFACLSAAALAAPPRLPDTTKGSKRCDQDVRNRHGAHFRVFVTRGEKRVSCRRARSIVKLGIDVPGWRYWDWTKGGNGPWSDVWRRHDHRAIVAAILRCVEGLDDDDDLPSCEDELP